MNHYSSIVTLAAASAFVLGPLAAVRPAVATPTLPLPPPGPSRIVGPPFEHVVRPGIETPIVIQTSPRAVCSFYSEQQNDARHRHRLDADDRGIVRVFAKARGAMPQAMKLALDCTREDGGTAKYSLAVRADAHAPLASTLDRPIAATGRPRPPLSAAALELSDRELVARGYPRRPDKVKAPGAYAKWLYIVSHTFNAVVPRKVRRSDVSFSPTLPVPPPHRASASKGTSLFDYTSSTWSGAVVTNPQVRFYQISDDWTTPSAGYVPPSIGYAAAAEWAGLDNAGNDLVQTGTDSESWDFYGLFGEISFTNYWAWIESLPDAPWGLPNFPVSPGDQISVDIFLADQNGNVTLSNGDLTPSDDSVWFMIYNLTTGNSYWGTLPRPAAFSGSSAEFVVERPSSYNTGSPYPLANFGIAGAHDCWFADTWFGFSSLDYNGSPPYPFTLNNLTMQSSDTLASSYTYANFGAPGGGNLLWVWQNYL